MPKRFLKKLIPQHHKIKAQRQLKIFGTLLHTANLWHLNRTAVSRAIAIGLFTAFLPIPFQMVVAAALAIFWGANLPLAVILVWISNPITMPPMFYFAYRLGCTILGIRTHTFNIELSFAWLAEKIGEFWHPLLLGSLACGLVSAFIGYFAMRLIWRITIIRRWRKRSAAQHKVVPEA